MVELFPNEKAGTYYTQSQPETVFAPKKTHSGYLVRVTAFRTKKDRLIKAGIREDRSRSRRRNPNPPLNPSEKLPNVLSPERILNTDEGEKYFFLIHFFVIPLFCLFDLRRNLKKYYNPLLILLWHVFDRELFSGRCRLLVTYWHR